MLVDTGSFLSNERTAHGDVRADAAAKNDLILKAYDQFRVDVVNISAFDLGHISNLLKRDRWLSADPSSVSKRMVSANLVSDSSNLVAPPPFIVREIPTTAAGRSKLIKVAFIGLAESSPDVPRGLKVVDPAEAARRVVPRARQLADVVVVLAHGKVAEVVEVARAALGADVVIAGTGDMFTPPLRVGPTLVAFTPFESRLLGELRFFRDAQGKFSIRTRYISLDESLGDDPIGAKTAAEVSDAGLTVFKENQKLLADWLVLSRTRDPKRRNLSPPEEGAATLV